MFSGGEFNSSYPAEYHCNLDGTLIIEYTYNVLYSKYWRPQQRPTGAVFLGTHALSTSRHCHRKNCSNLFGRERDFRTRSYLGPGVEGYPDKFPIFVRRRLQGDRTSKKHVNYRKRKCSFSDTQQRSEYFETGVLHGISRRNFHFFIIPGHVPNPRVDFSEMFPPRRRRRPEAYLGDTQNGVEMGLEWSI